MSVLFLLVALQYVCHGFVVPHCGEEARPRGVRCSALKKNQEQVDLLQSRIVEGKGRKVDGFKSTLGRLVLSPVTDAAPPKSRKLLRAAGQMLAKTAILAFATSPAVAAAAPGLKYACYLGFGGEDDAERWGDIAGGAKDIGGRAAMEAATRSDAATRATNAVATTAGPKFLLVPFFGAAYLFYSALVNKSVEKENKKLKEANEKITQVEKEYLDVKGQAESDVDIAAELRKQRNTTDDSNGNLDDEEGPRRPPTRPPKGPDARGSGGGAGGSARPPTRPPPPSGTRPPPPSGTRPPPPGTRPPPPSGTRSPPPGTRPPPPPRGSSTKREPPPATGRPAAGAPRPPPASSRPPPPPQRSSSREPPKPASAEDIARLNRMMGGVGNSTKPRK